MAPIDIWLGFISLAVVPAGGWTIKKVIDHDKELAVQQLQLTMILDRVDDIRDFLKEGKPIV